MLSYAENKIAEAIRLAKGNPTRARQTVMEWCEKDSKLLIGLTRAHLNGIVAYNIDRVASGRADKAKEKTPPPQKPKIPTQEKFGMEILKAVVGSSSQFGMDTPPRKKGQASQQHIDAIKALAAKSKAKK